jgi:DNA polymerase iota
LGSHLAKHLRDELESQKGYTAAVGISTNKILSKLVGSKHKPRNQTTLMPPYEQIGSNPSSVTRFMDQLDLHKVPGVGYKMVKKIMSKVLGRAPVFHDDALIIFGTEEKVTVADVRTFPGMGPEMLEEILGGVGSPKGIGGLVWSLLHGVDSSEVGRVKRVPSQISQEDSYTKYLHSLEQVHEQLMLLSIRLIKRMHVDLMEDDEELLDQSSTSRRWLAHPKTIRLSTRPRPPVGPDGVRARTFQRLSKSAPLPTFIFSLKDAVEDLAERLVGELLMRMFRKLHPDKVGWNLSLINIAVTNMVETAAETKDSEGRDIGRMFRIQEDVLKDFRVIDESPKSADPLDMPLTDAEGAAYETGSENSDMDWAAEGEEGVYMQSCTYCQARLPQFAMTAHEQYHMLDHR